jgi:hypothetical protein
MARVAAAEATEEPKLEEEATAALDVPEEATKTEEKEDGKRKPEEVEPSTEKLIKEEDKDSSEVMDKKEQVGGSAKPQL